MKPPNAWETRFDKSGLCSWTERNVFVPNRLFGNIVENLATIDVLIHSVDLVSMACADPDSLMVNIQTVVMNHTWPTFGQVCFAGHVVCAFGLIN